jgi:hypothetical protein
MVHAAPQSIYYFSNMKLGRPRNFFRVAAMPINLAGVWRRTRRSEAIILHNGRFKAIPPKVLIPLFCRSRRGALSKPQNLTILLVHNRPTKTLMEQSLDYLGISDYSVLRASTVRWRHSIKISMILDYLLSGKCQTEYVLFCDSDDALMRDDPQRATDLFQNADCDMLVSSTTYARYRLMPDVRDWTVSIAPEDLRKKRRPHIHLNTGVYIARTAFLKEYLKAAMQYVTEGDLGQELHGMTDAEVLARLPEFPRGIGSDQTIMRYLFPRFHPRMKIDYESRLAFR